MGIGLLLLALAATAIALNPRPSTSNSPVESELIGTQPNLSARVPAGQVATALRLSRTEGAAGAIRPGDTIDVYAFFPQRATGGAPSTRVLLREKLVYAATQEMDLQSVTLVMPPQEAVLLQDALQIGARPYATIRSSKGMPVNEAPVVFGDEALAAWIARLGAGR